MRRCGYVVTAGRSGRALCKRRALMRTCAFGLQGRQIFVPGDGMSGFPRILDQVGLVDLKGAGDTSAAVDSSDVDALIAREQACAPVEPPVSSDLS